MRKDGEERVPGVKGPPRVPVGRDKNQQTNLEHLQATNSDGTQQNKSENSYTKKKKSKHKGPTQVTMLPQDVASARLELIPQEVIERYRLTPDQIRLLDRFKDYSPGEPSEVWQLETEICYSRLFHV